MTQIPRYWFNSSGTAGVLTRDDYDFIEDNDWRVIITVYYGALDNYGTGLNLQYAERAQTFVDHDIKVLFGLESPLSYNNYIVNPVGPTRRIWYNTTIDQYEEWLGPGIDYYGDRFGSDLIGYQWEQGFHNGVQWICDKAHEYGRKTIQDCGNEVGHGQQYAWFWRWWWEYYRYTHEADWPNFTEQDYLDAKATGTYYGGFWGNSDFEFRCNIVDLMMNQDFYVSNVPLFMSDYLDIQANHYPCQFGLKTGWCEDGDPKGLGFWNEAHPDPTQTWDDQVALFEAWIGYAEQIVGTFDAYQFQMYPANRRMWEYDAVLDHFKTRSDGRYAQKTRSYGIAPLYKNGIRQCDHVGLLQDDGFLNTGNELLLLKDINSVATHDITVTSTDTLSHKDYNLTLSPGKGTVIGPYPLAGYGELPTITYDSPNLYVSILKVEPAV
jgi:hypothetical protein